MSKIVLIIITCGLFILINPISANCPDGKGGSLRPGQTVQIPGKCLSMICAENGLPVYGHCPPVHPRKGCKTGKQDLSKPFPQCCPKENCPSDDTAIRAAAEARWWSGK